MENEYTFTTIDVLTGQIETRQLTDEEIANIDAMNQEQTA